MCDILCCINTYSKTETIQRRLAWTLHNDDTEIREAFEIFSNIKPPCRYSLAIVSIRRAGGNLLSAGSSYIVQTTGAHVALPTDSMRSVCLHLHLILLKIWNVSRIYRSSMRRSQGNLFCIVLILIYVFCRKTLMQFAPR